MTSGVPVTKEATINRQGVNWFTTVVLVFLHIGAIGALFVFSWKALALTILSYYVATGLGISMGYHRLHTHRSYKVPLWLEYFFATCGTLTLEGGPRGAPPRPKTSTIIMRPPQQGHGGR